MDAFKLADKVVGIFDSVRKNDPMIKNSRFSEIHRIDEDAGIALSMDWGTKRYLDYSAEQRLIELHRIQPKRGLFSLFITEPNLPESVLIEDWYSASARINYDGSWHWNNKFLNKDLLADNTLLLSEVDRILNNPSHHYSVAVKGRNYWRKPYVYKKGSNGGYGYPDGNPSQ